jgi:formylglycine-generating enzyme required for sulfatase activity
LGGNLFYGNTANNGSIVGNGSANSLGYNISDMANGASGYSFTTGDTQVSASSISPVSFKPYVGSAVLSSVNPSAIPNYPTVDFYGDPIPASFAAAGAVQTAGTGYAFTLTTQGNGTIGGAPAASADGFYTSGSSFILTASAASGYSFAYWTVNGVKQSGTGNLSVTLNENKEVRAVFGRNAAGSGYVFTTTGEYRQTITVAGSSVTIEGSDNGFSDKGVFVAGRTVTLSPYSMAKYQTTWELWNEVRTWAQSHGYSIENEGYQGHDSVSSSGSGSGTSGSSWTVEQRQRRPVTMISWYDAIVWCNAYSEMSGLEPVYYYNEVILERSADGGKAVMDRSKNGYRLPTEAEWEFAARGGDPTAADWAYEYAGSDTAGDVGWYYDNAYSNAGTDYGAHTVGTKAANRLGIYDLSGNVWEWCWDWYGGSLSGSVTDPAGASSGSYRVLRGGGWCSDAQDLRSSYRFYYRPDYRYYYYGFRIVRF